MKLNLEKETKRSPFEELTELVNEVWRLQKEAKELWRTLNEYASEAPHPLILHMIKELESLEEIPEPIKAEEELKGLVSSLKEYVDYSRERIESLREYLRSIRDLSAMLIEIEEKVPLLEAWSETLKNIEPKVSSEALRAINKVRRIRETKSVKDIRRITDEVSEVLKNVYYTLRLCQRVYDKKLSLIREQVESAIKLYKGARKIADISSISMLEGAYARLIHAQNIIEDVKRRAPFVDVDLLQVEKEVQEILRTFKEIFDSSMKGNEMRVLKALGTLVPQYGDRALPLHIVIMQISRLAEMNIDEVLKTLFVLSKRRLVPIKIKIS